MTEVMTAEKNKDLIMPVLELESVDDPVVNQLEVQDAEAFRMQQFSPEELNQINEFADKIDLHDSNLMVTYGAGAQKRLAEFSE